MKYGSSYVPVSETTNEMLANVHNYEEVYHNHQKVQEKNIKKRLEFSYEKFLYYFGN